MKRIYNNKLLFALAISLALFVRLYGIGNAYIKACDPYFFYRVAESFLTKGYFEPNDKLRYYPIGWDTRELTPGLPWLLAYLAKLCGDLKVASLWYSAIFGTLAIIVFSFLAARFGFGSLAALLLGAMPAFYYRTSQGFADKEPLSFFLGFTGWYFAFRALEEAENKKKALLYAILAGISFGLNNAVWGGKLLFVFALLPLVFWFVWKKDYDRALLLSFSLLLEEPFGFFVPRYKLFYKSIYFQILFAVFFFVLLLKLLEKKAKGKELYYALGISLALLLAASQIIYSNPFFAIQRFLAVVYSPVRATTRISLGQTVAENQRPTWTWKLPNNVYWQNSGLAFFVALAVLYYALKDWRAAFIASIVLAFYYASSTAVRLLILIAPAAALGSAYVLNKLLQSREKAFRYLSIALALLISYPFVWPRSSLALPIFEQFSKGTTSIFTYAKAASGTSMNQRWYEALKWLYFNTPQQEPIVTWWDYGYWIQTVANRTSVGDGGNVGPGPKLNHLLGKFLANENVSYSLQWLRSINASYVILDYALVPKFWAYSTLGGMSNVIGILRYQGQSLVPGVGMADIYAGNSYMGPVMIAVTNIGGEPRPLLAKLELTPTGYVPRVLGVVEEIMTPYGNYKTKPFGKYSIVNETAVFIYPGQVAYFGNFKAMHSFFARLWFQDGLGLPCKELFNNYEVKIFKCY